MDESFKFWVQVLLSPVLIAITTFLIKNWFHSIREQITSLVASIKALEDWRLKYVTRNTEQMRSQRRRVKSLERRLQRLEDWKSRDDNGGGIG